VTSPSGPTRPAIHSEPGVSRAGEGERGEEAEGDPEGEDEQRHLERCAAASGAVGIPL
jgi:hypothetical protein